MLDRMKIASRLMMGFGVLVLLIAGLMGTSIYSSRLTSVACNDATRRLTSSGGVERIEKRMFQARMDVFQALATGQMEYWDDFTKAIQRAKDRQEKIYAVTRNATRKAEVAEIGKEIAEFEQAGLKLKSFAGKNAVLDGAEAKSALSAMIGLSSKLETSGEKLAKEYEDAASEAVIVLNDTVDNAIQMAILIGSISLALGILLSILVTKSVIKPVHRLTEATSILATGQTDLVVPETQRVDELGPLAQALEGWRQGLLESQKHQRQEQERIQASEARHQRIDAAMRTFDHEIQTLLNRINDAAGHMLTSYKTLSANAEQTQRQSSAVAAASEQATTNVEGVAAAEAELSASIDEITRQVTLSADTARNASHEADAAKTKIAGLSDAAAKIGEVVSLITEIASQTNLLALNATIESARAGEAGKGFAVVANEVKGLAGQTGRATDDIARQINNVQQETLSAVNAVVGIVSTIDRINELSSAIASAVEEQSAATSEIARNVGQASQGTREVSANIAGVAQAAAETGSMANVVYQAASVLLDESKELEKSVVTFLEAVRAA